MSLVKDRLYRRFEKVLITVESMLIGMFVGGCWGIFFNSVKIGVIWMLIIFIITTVYKRHIIEKERS